MKYELILERISKEHNLDSLTGCASALGVSPEMLTGLRKRSVCFPPPRASRVSNHFLLYSPPEVREFVNEWRRLQKERREMVGSCYTAIEK